MKKINLIIGMLSVVMLVSCSDFLIKEPKGTMDEDRFFTTQRRWIQESDKMLSDVE